MVETYLKEFIILKVVGEGFDEYGSMSLPSRADSVIYNNLELKNVLVPMVSVVAQDHVVTHALCYHQSPV